MKQILNNKKYYSNGHLSLKKVLFGFLNEDVQRLDDYPLAQNLIDKIEVNIGYIPCYNFNDMTKDESELQLLKKIKQTYKNAEADGDEDVTRSLEKMFARVLIARQFITGDAINEPDDSLTHVKLKAALDTQLGPNGYINVIKVLTEQAREIISNELTAFFNQEEVTTWQKLVGQELIEVGFGFNDCLTEEEKPAPSDNPPVAMGHVNAWYRFPQLNGGFFEMADSLLNPAKMKAIQDTGRKYKQYEKQGTMYGLINNQGAPDEESAKNFINFFKSDWKNYLAVVTQNAQLDQTKVNKIGQILNSFTKRELGRILDEFFKNRMVKVGEYYLLDTVFLIYCLLIAAQKAGFDIKDEQIFDKFYQGYVTSRQPKIIKAKVSPEELPNPDQIANAEIISPQKLTIKQMFKGRADNNMSNYNKAAANAINRPNDSPLTAAEKEQMKNYSDAASKNMARSNRERIYR